MCEMKIGENVTIDVVENAVTEIEKLSGREVKDPEIIRVFAETEKDTRFYVSEGMKVMMEPDQSSRYLWIDTGFTDRKGNPIFISTMKKGGQYVGHITGTMYTLRDQTVNTYRTSRAQVTENMERFKTKYATKVSKRTRAHIGDELDYFLGKTNATAVENAIREAEQTAIGKLLSGLDITYAPGAPVQEIVETEEPVSAATALRAEAPLEFSVTEKEITIGLLMDKVKELQDFSDKLLGIIESQEMEGKQQIEELKKENEDLKKAFVQIRTFNQQENDCDEEEDACTGHKLLGRNKKILVVGASGIDEDTMTAIAKRVYGFEKADLEYELDYDKVKDAAGRIMNSSRFDAVIFGACPHKAKEMGDASAFTNACGGSMVVAQAREYNGKLKMTKESFKRAMEEVVEGLKKQKAVCA